MQEVVHHARVERNKVLDVAQQRPVASTGQQRVTGSQAAVAVAVVVVVVVVALVVLSCLRSLSISKSKSK